MWENIFIGFIVLAVIIGAIYGKRGSYRSGGCWGGYDD